MSAQYTKTPSSIVVPFFDYKLFVRMAQTGMFDVLWKRLSDLKPKDVVKKQELVDKFNKIIVLSFFFLCGWFLNAKGLGQWWQKTILFCIIVSAMYFVYRQVNKMHNESIQRIKNGAYIFFESFCDGSMNSHWANRPDVSIAITALRELIPFREADEINHILLEQMYINASKLGFCNAKAKDEARITLAGIKNQILEGEAGRIKRLRNTDQRIEFDKMIVDYVSKMKLPQAN